tara:strand:- start:13 stop:903 length:891 start_codon:yes stop_codon:yes gene_type:complete
MIKLFWNTHNQKKSNSDNKKIKEKEELDYWWGKYHKKNSDKWIYEMLNKIDYEVIEDETKLEKNDILIIVDSSVEEKHKFYSNLSLICSKIFLFHLGDEYGFHNLTPVYNNCNFIWRPFCSNRYFKNERVKCIPIGYKSGVLNKNKKKRELKWSFAGTPHKSSRHDLLYQLSDIKPFFCHKTEKFDKKIISLDEMNDVLSSTEFIPCPYGFFHPETYRVYEALECGCIPIVEEAYQYYDRLFPNNPFIKINKWKDAKLLLQEWDDDRVKEKREECIIWWKNMKKEIQNAIKNKVDV